ncbi:MAG: molybdopterin molybdotransferase MoeA [Gemmatimonadetes bacterium]|nr:molybdopterin molybdotransferase MoeA [Gemmatimonadota bacterium]
MPQFETLPADWLSAGDAIARIKRSIVPLPPEEIALTAALGRALAADIRSPVTLPPWDNSAMDGFAVRASDIRGASVERPVRLELVGHVSAGAFPERPVGSGQAVKVMTGAPVPAGADSVVRVEDTDAGRRQRERVSVYSDRDAGRNIRRQGEDVREGHTVLTAGTTLTPARLALLAAIGKNLVPVRERPRIAILSNGDELADLDAFDQVLSGRKILNSNGYGLVAGVVAAGGEPVYLGIARDDPEDIRRRLEGMVSADGLVTSAGASVGEHDLLKRTLAGLGFELDFWRVRIRPGSPFGYGFLPRRGGGRLPVFSLPGNPVSALVTFELFVRPALRLLAGHGRPFRSTVIAAAAERLSATKGLTHFLRVRLGHEGCGWAAHLTGPQGSGILSSVAAADGLAVIPEEAGEIAPGETVKVLLLDEGAASGACPF